MSNLKIFDKNFYEIEDLLLNVQGFEETLKPFTVYLTNAKEYKTFYTTFKSQCNT